MVERTRVSAVIDRIVAAGTLVARLDGTSHDVFPVAASADEGEALRRWVIRERAQKTIEIGLGYGISTLFICDGLLRTGVGDLRHVAIDPHQQSRFSDCGLQLLADAGVLDLVEHHAAPSELVLPRLVADEARFDLAFVDGNHRFDAVFVDLYYLGRLVEPGGIVFLDDYQLPAVRRAASFYVSNLRWAVEEVSPSNDLHQWCVLRTSREADERRFDDFADF
jgi:predicted O-methyltransferase YrrM